MTDENRSLLLSTVDKWSKALDIPGLSKHWKTVYILFNTSLICSEEIEKVSATLGSIILIYNSDYVNDFRIFSDHRS